MGDMTKWTCQCGYETTIDEGPGFRVSLKGMLCRDCKELVSVLGDEPYEGAYNEEMQARVGRCPICQGTNLKRMSRNQPCPKCGGQMKADDVGNWD